MNKNKTKTSVEKQPKSKSDKISLIVGIVLCAILLPILALNVSLIIIDATNGTMPPAIAGYSPMIVETPSMNPLIKPGDIIFVNQNVEAKDVKPGDVICFFDPAQPNETFTVTHRVIAIKDGKAITAGDFNVQGDYEKDLNGAKDDAAKKAIEAKIDRKTDKNAGDYEYIVYKGDKDGEFTSRDLHEVDLEKKLVGIYTYKRIPGVGKVSMFMQSPAGWIICIAVPLLAFIAYEIISRKMKDKNNSKDMDALLAELEALKAAKAAEGADKSETKDSSTDADDVPKKE